MPQIIAQSHALLAKYYNHGKICPLCVIHAAKRDGICSCKNRCPSPVKRDYFKDEIETMAITQTPAGLFASLGLRYEVQSDSSSSVDSSSDSDNDDDVGDAGVLGGVDSVNGPVVSDPNATCLHKVNESSKHVEKHVNGKTSPSPPIGHTRAEATAAAPSLSSPQKSARTLLSTIMVENLSSKAERQDLITMFQSNSTVSKIYFHINAQGERSGSALVEFSSPSGAKAALSLNGIICMGVSVKISMSGITISGMEQLDHDFRLQHTDPNNCLVAYVSNLPANTKERDILEFFHLCGSIVSAKIVSPTLPTPAPPFAKVTFSSSSSCKAALELDGASLKGHTIIVDYVPPAHCSVSPPPSVSRGSLLIGSDVRDDDLSAGFQWLEGLPGTPLCPKSLESKDCTVEFTQYFSEPADDLSRQGRFVARAKVNGNNYTKDVYFRGFRWEGREVRVGDVVLLEADQAEWVARVDSCWEERKNLNKPQNNRRLVSLMWYYHKKDLLNDVASSRKKLDATSKFHLNHVWNDGNELLFSDHVEEEQDIGSITGINVTIVDSEEQYHFCMQNQMKQNSRVFLHRYTYEDRCRVVERFNPLTPRTANMVHAATSRAASGGADAHPNMASVVQKKLNKRGLADIELEMKSNSAHKQRPSKTTRDADNDDDAPLKKKKTSKSSDNDALESSSICEMKPYAFKSWAATKDDLMALLSRLNGLTEKPSDRPRKLQLDAEIGGLLSLMDERMPTYKDLQRTHIHVSLRQFYKQHPGNNNASLARSIWNRWKCEFDRHGHTSAAADSSQPPVANLKAPILPNSQVFGAPVPQNVAPVPRENHDALRTGMKARLLRAFKEHITLALPIVVKPERCDIVSGHIERGVYVEYHGAGDQYKRHIELLLSCICGNRTFALHLLQGCVETSAVTSSLAFKDSFMEARRAGISVANKLKVAPKELPHLPVLSSVQSLGEAEVVEASPERKPTNSRIMAALGEERDLQSKSSMNQWDEGSGGGWSVQDENFDYGI